MSGDLADDADSMSLTSALYTSSIRQNCVHRLRGGVADCQSSTLHIVQGPTYLVRQVSRRGKHESTATPRDATVARLPCPQIHTDSKRGRFQRVGERTMRERTRGAPTFIWSVMLAKQSHVVQGAQHRRLIPWREQNFHVDFTHGGLSALLLFNLASVAVYSKRGEERNLTHSL